MIYIIKYIPRGKLYYIFILLYCCIRGRSNCARGEYNNIFKLYILFFNYFLFLIIYFNYILIIFLTIFFTVFNFIIKIY